ncbi:hypothetical protein ES705_07305 [subsurface metagenome]
MFDFEKALKKKMKINNLLQMNDWGIKNFIIAVLAIQLAMWGVIGLDVMGLQIPILRQLIGFIYLSFVPGILILRILKLHKLGNIETLLYTVGLSIATLMFTGFFMNMIYPFFGISGPISTVPLIITISVVVLALSVISYMRDKDFSDPSFIDTGEILSPPALFLCLIPFMAVLGTYLVNFHHNNILLMLMIVVIALIVLLIAFDKFIPNNLYPLAVFVIAISLLYHNSLISMYLWGWDIHVEYYFHKLVETNGFWDYSIPANYNSVLSSTIFPTIYSNLLNLEGTWVFKIIYPFHFALLPLGLYHIFKNQTDEKIAFLSIFYFISLFTFYTELLALAKQQMAEIFYMLLILVILNKDMNSFKGKALYIVFGIGIVMSHYGTTYLYMLFSLVAFGIMVYILKHKSRVFTQGAILLFIVFGLSWYMYNSSSSAFITIVNTGDHIANSIYTEFLNPGASQALTIFGRASISPLHQVSKILYYTSQFFILIGVTKLALSILRRNEIKFDKEFAAFSIMSFGVFLVCVFVPHFTHMNIRRMYHILMFFLAPFCVIGGVTVFRMLAKVVKASWTEQRVKSSLKILSVFLVIFLLFNTGWVYEVAKDHPGSIALSQESSTKDYPLTNEQEALSGEWLRDKRDIDTTIYADEYRGLSLAGTAHIGKYRVFWGDEEMTTRIPDNVYIFLGRENVKNKKIILITPVKRERKSVDLQNLTFYNTLLNMSRIYNNSDAEMYYQ